MRQPTAKVLVMETDSGRAAEFAHRLRYLHYEPVVAASTERLRDADIRNGIALLLGETGMTVDFADAVRSLLDERPEMPVLLAAGAPHMALPATAREPWQLDLPIRRTQLSQYLKCAERCTGRERRLTGHSPGIRQVRQLIDRVAAYDTNVLITGESGTGKELVARCVHDQGERADAPFVPINCGAIPPELLESELFGHEKGAFTGAVATRVGRFELAAGGTLFLDEIGDMSLDMQVKLLRVLQERTFERVGSNRSRTCDVRIIAATHRDLPTMVADGSFREDLFYRLNVFPIEMPPLKKRAADLPALLDELLVLHCQDGGEGLRLAPDAIAALAAYPWPGNIRELSNLVERLAIMFPDGEIGLDDLPEKYRATPPAPAAVADIELPTGGTLRDYLGSVERELIVKALANAGGVVARAARQLRTRRTTLLEKITKYSISVS